MLRASSGRLQQCLYSSEVIKHHFARFFFSWDQECTLATSLSLTCTCRCNAQEHGHQHCCLNVLKGK